MAKQTNKNHILQIVIAIILIAGGYLVFRQVRMGEYVHYITYFKDIRGLQPSSPVQVNGVRVGKISDIILENDQLKVTLAISKDIPLNEGTKASLANGGATGEKIIMLEQGIGKKILAENAVLVSNMDSSVLPISVRITPMIESAKMILNSADVGLTGVTYLIKGGLSTQSLEMLIAVDKKAAALESLAEGLNKKTAVLVKPLVNAKDATADMAAHTAQTTQSIQEIETGTSKALRTDFSKNLDTLRNNMAVLGKSFKKLKEIQPLNEKKSYDNAAQSSKKINTSVKDLMKKAGANTDTL